MLTTILSLTNTNYCQEVFRPWLKFPGWPRGTGRVSGQGEQTYFVWQNSAQSADNFFICRAWFSVRPSCLLPTLPTWYIGTDSDTVWRGNLVWLRYEKLLKLYLISRLI